MPISNSTAAQMARNALAVSGFHAHAKELPASASAIATTLDKRSAVIAKLNADQEAARATLKLASQALNKELKQATRERQQLIRLAEATWGPRAPQIGEFRSAVDNKA